MARTSRLTTIENQIKSKQEKLFELKEKSDAIADEIQDLLAEKEKQQKEELMKLISESGRTYEEIAEFLKTAPKRGVETTSAKRKGRPRKAKSDD